MTFSVCTPLSGGSVLVRFSCTASASGGTHVMSDLLGLFSHSDANIVDWRADVGTVTYMTGYFSISPEGLAWLNRLLANGVRGANLDLEVVPSNQIATICIIAVDEPGIQSQVVAELAWRDIPQISSRGAKFSGSESGTHYYACNVVVRVCDVVLNNLQLDFEEIANRQGWEVCSVERGFQLLDFAAAISLEQGL